MNERLRDAGYQAFRILQFAFIVIPILAGLDKFFYLMTSWSQYLCPYVIHFFGGHDRIAMVLAGIIEIGVGVGVFYRPKIFSYVVSLWLLFIIVNLFFLGNFYDIALRDFGLFLAAFSLGRLASQYA